jgi:hypothetical protein
MNSAITRKAVIVVCISTQLYNRRTMIFAHFHHVLTNQNHGLMSCKSEPNLLSVYGRIFLSIIEFNQFEIDI